MCVQRQYRKSHTHTCSHTHSHTHVLTWWRQPLTTTQTACTFSVNNFVCPHEVQCNCNWNCNWDPKTEFCRPYPDSGPNFPFIRGSRVLDSIPSTPFSGWRTFLRWNVNFPPTTFQQFVNRSWPSASSFGLPIANNDNDWKIAVFEGMEAKDTSACQIAC